LPLQGFETASFFAHEVAEVAVVELKAIVELSASRRWLPSASSISPASPL